MSLNFDASLVFDKGLSNYMGHNNCFLNSAVQVLWHLDVFRKNFLALKHHYCIQGPCIYCSLQDIFKEFNESAEDVLHPDMLRVTLATAFQDQLKFQLGEIDDASECYENILSRIHFHLTQGAEDDSCLLKHCITHNKFAMSLIHQTQCDCGSTSEPFPFMQLVHFISTSSVVKFSNIEKSKNFGEILKLAFGSGQSSRSCSANCQYTSRVIHTLVNLPDVVNIGLIWESDQSDPSHIKQFVSAIQTSINLEDLFDKVLEGNGCSERDLVGMVCYYMKHYSTFFFHSKKKTWISFDDASVNEIGKDWTNVVEKCCKGRYQPLLLIYQNPNAELVDISTAPLKTTHINNDFEGMKSSRNKCSNNSSDLLALNHLHEKDTTVLKYLNKYTQPQTYSRDLPLKHSHEPLCRPPIHEYKHPAQEKEDYGLISLSSSYEQSKPKVCTRCSRVDREEMNVSDSERLLLPSWTLISIRDKEEHASTKTSRAPSPIYDNLSDYDYPSINEVHFQEPSKNNASRYSTKELDEIINRKLIKDKVKAMYR